MIQQFFQTQLKTQPSQTWRDLPLTVACALGQGHHTARNIVRWEKSWVEEREIFERKERVDGDLWMYNENVNNAIKEFIKA